MGKHRLFAAAVAVIALCAPALAQADRKPTPKEKAQIASVVHLPVVCAKVRVSTVTKKPKWGTVSWKRGGPQCDPLASDGVTVAKKTKGRWRLVTAGSSFGCAELYVKVPQEIAKDLRIRCEAIP
jgi:hypothetical protein